MSHNRVMAGVTSFGKLSCLPVELRRLIWEKVSPCAAVACLSSAICEEYQHITYENLSIKFSQHFGKHRCATVTTNHGALMESINLDASGGTILPNWLQALPWARVKTLIFSLDHPELEDPGQMVDRWQTTTLLLNMIIKRANPFPPVHIRVKQGVWGQCDTSNDISDLETALMPFLRLATYSHISVSLPETLVLIPSYSEVSIRATSSDVCINQASIDSRVLTLVGEICQGTADYDFRNYIDYLQNMRFLQTSELLDNPPGRTASILRWERSAN